MHDGPRWRVHIATAGVTCVRLAAGILHASDPWPLTRAVADVVSAGATRTDRPHAVGSGRGVPIIHRQAMQWKGCDCHLEAHLVDGRAEVSLELPAWDELTERVDDEDDVWDLIDIVAAAISARWGALGDGEPLGDTPDLRRHAGILVPERDTDTFRVSPAYTMLQRSGLAVLLR